MNNKNIEHFEFFYPPNSRFNEIKKIFQYIKAGNSCQLVGLPGVGRGSILNLLSYNRSIREAHVGENQKWFHFVGVDFSEVKGKPLFDVIKLIFLELTDSLRERKLIKEHETIEKLFKDSLSFHDELVLFQGLKKAIDFLAIEKELTIIFLFDRFELYIPYLTSDFFSNLRILRNRAKYRFSVIFSLPRPLEDIVDTSIVSDFYEFVVGNIVYLSLGDKNTTDFRINYLEKVSGKKIDKKIIEEILKLTAGHGKLTRLCLESVLANKDSHYSQFFLSQKTIQGTLLEIWYFLTPEEQSFLAKAEDLEETFLEKVGLIKNGKITIPLFQQFVKENLSKQPEQKIVYDEALNSIKRGNDLLSDMLTLSEFKLLKLLLIHKGNIIERQQIIDTVWGELASTQGVTDQAIDQLIFRLRKKIEEDPAKPEHILTVKGRGVKFQETINK